MNQLQRKCLVASASFHLLLILTLLIGSAFVAPVANKPKAEGAPQVDQPVIQILRVPQQQQESEAPQPASLPAAVVQPVPVPKAVQRTSAPVRDSFETASESKPTQSPLTLRPVTRYPASRPTSGKSVPTENRAQKFTQAVDGMFRNLSSGTPVNLSFSGGQGEGDDAYAQVVRATYTRGWDPFEADGASEDATARVSVTIACDGRVVGAHVVKSSGDAMVDKSVQRVLRQVTVIAPFGADAREKERTYTINFNLRAKRLLDSTQ